MRAVVMRDRRLVVDDVPDPVPGRGQVLGRVLACGICGSDLHALAHGDRLAAATTEAAGDDPSDPMRPHPMDVGRDVVMGHEFCVEVLALGDNVGNVAEGDVVVSMPVIGDADGTYPLGYANRYPGGYAERMLLSGPLCMPVPAGLDHRRAALTEPLAVGIHAVHRSRIASTDAAVVLGCGPVGLAVVAALRMEGVGVIVAADLSPRRRELAGHLGATEVVDPREEPAVAAWRRVDGRRPLVLFEAVGVPGMIDAAIGAVPRKSRIAVVGVCMEDDVIRPLVAVGKEVDLAFALGYDPLEFMAALSAIAGGLVDVGALITGTVDLDGVPGAFSALADPDRHAKILVEPGSGASL
jgi:threonine dehydrogenase-like Zn-dependent dehydrogenase